MRIPTGQQSRLPCGIHTLNVVRQPIRVLTDNPVYLLSILLIYFHCQVHRDAVLLKENHRLPQITFFIHLIRNLHRLALADSLYFRQPLRLLLDNPKGIRLESAHNPRCQRQTNSADRPGTEIAFDGFLVFRRFLLKTFDLKLFTVSRMIGIVAGCLNVLPSAIAEKIPRR